MPMGHAKTDGAHTLGAFSIINTIISIDTKKVMLLIFRTNFVSFMVNASLIMKKEFDTIPVCVDCFCQT